MVLIRSEAASSSLLVLAIGKARFEAQFRSTPVRSSGGRPDAVGAEVICTFVLMASVRLGRLGRPLPNMGMATVPSGQYRLAKSPRHSESSAPIQFVNAMNALRFAMGLPMVLAMTFIIEAMKDDHRLTEIRSSAIVAVILARKLAAEGFEVSISAPTGDHYSADKFNMLLTSKNLDSQRWPATDESRCRPTGQARGPGQKQGYLRRSWPR
jgi:hypothetical protein